MVPCSVVRHPWSLSGLMSRKGVSTPPSHDCSRNAISHHGVTRRQVSCGSPASFAEQNVAGNLRSLMKQALLSKR